VVSVPNENRRPENRPLLKLFLVIAGFPRMPQDRYDWPHMGGFVVVWLVVAGMGLLALLDPGSIDVLVTAEL
jgi:hypothetical protein